MTGRVEAGAAGGQRLPLDRLRPQHRRDRHRRLPLARNANALAAALELDLGQPGFIEQLGERPNQLMIDLLLRGLLLRHLSTRSRPSFRLLLDVTRHNSALGFSLWRREW